MKIKQSEIEVKSLVMAVLVTVLVAIGGIVEIVPLLQMRTEAVAIPEVKPYSPLELEGRDIYLREGCYVCHSQQVRPFPDETERYGPFSKAGESVYDHPFQWGSKRTGPDLARVGGKYPDSWHYIHMRNPRDMEPDSVMPNYYWLLDNKLDLSLTRRKLIVQRQVGVPYTDDQINGWEAAVSTQAEQIVARLKTAGVADAQPDREIIALIAYLQRLGTDIGWRNKVGAR